MSDLTPIALAKLGQTFPVGQVIQGVAQPNANWLALDGSSYPKANYPALANILTGLPFTLSEASWSSPQGVPQPRMNTYTWRQLPDETILVWGYDTGSYVSYERRIIWGKPSTGWKTCLLPAPAGTAYNAALYSAFVCGNVVMAIAMNSSTTYALYKSLDGGVTWTVITLAGLFTKVVCDATGLNIMAVDTSQIVNVSVDGGANWVKLYQIQTPAGNQGNYATVGAFYAIDYDATTGEWVFLAQSRDTAATPNYYFWYCRSVGGPGGPYTCTNILGTNVYPGGVTPANMAITSKRGNNLVINWYSPNTTAYMFAYSTDGGFTWTKNTAGTEGIPGWGLALWAGRIYCCVDGGPTNLYYAPSGTQSWVLAGVIWPASSNMPSGNYASVWSATHLTVYTPNRSLFDASNALTTVYHENSHSTDVFSIYESGVMYYYRQYATTIKTQNTAGDDGATDGLPILDRAGKTQIGCQAYANYDVNPMAYTDGSTTYMVSNYGEAHVSTDGINFTTKAAYPYNFTAGADPSSGYRYLPRSCFIGPQGYFFGTWQAYYSNTASLATVGYTTWAPAPGLQRFGTAANLNYSASFTDGCGNANYLLFIEYGSASTIYTRQITSSTAVSAYLTLNGRNIGCGTPTRVAYVNSTWLVFNTAGQLFWCTDSDPYTGTWNVIGNIPGTIVGAGYVGGSWVIATTTALWRASVLNAGGWALVNFTPPNAIAGTWAPVWISTGLGFLAVGGTKCFAVTGDGITWAYFDVTTLADANIENFTMVQGPAWLAYTPSRAMVRFTLNTAASGNFIAPAIPNKTPGLTYYIKAK